MRPFSWQRYASPNPKLPPKYPSQHECFLATHFITRWDTVVFFPPHLTQQPQVGQCFYIIEASLSHSDTPHSTGFLWLVISLLDNTQHSQETDIHDRGGIRTRNHSKQADTNPRLRPPGQWDRHGSTLPIIYDSSLFICECKKQHIRKHFRNCTLKWNSLYAIYVFPHLQPHL